MKPQVIKVIAEFYDADLIAASTYSDGHRFGITPIKVHRWDTLGNLQHDLDGSVFTDSVPKDIKLVVSALRPGVLKLGYRHVFYELHEDDVVRSYLGSGHWFAPVGSSYTGLTEVPCG